MLTSEKVNENIKAIDAGLKKQTECLNSLVAIQDDMKAFGFKEFEITGVNWGMEQFLQNIVGKDYRLPEK